MRRLVEASQFIGGDQGDVVSTASMDDDRLACIGRLIEQGLQIGTSVCVSGFGSHRILVREHLQLIPFLDRSLFAAKSKRWQANRIPRRCDAPLTPT